MAEVTTTYLPTYAFIPKVAEGRKKNADLQDGRQTRYRVAERQVKKRGIIGTRRPW